MKEKFKIGIIGCGNISSIYFENLQKSSLLEIVACADLLKERAQEKASKYQVPHVYSVEELLNDSEIQLVVNLTIPQAHSEVTLKAIGAGKHVYTEKPLALTKEEGLKILNAAQKQGVCVGNAPDTFLGAGLQTCRALIDQGVIGEPLAGSAFMMCHGHESWHPNPDFYYQKGGGPLFDMGPYYLTALVFLVGPVKSVQALAKVSFPERIITSQPRKGEKIKVEVPTHVTAILNLDNELPVSFVTSFDVWAARLPSVSYTHLTLPTN